MLKCQSFVRFLTHQKKPNASSPMDKDLFNKKTKDLLRYSRKLDRLVLAKLEHTEVCKYCDLPVTNQRLECAVHRLGTPFEHIKHKCKTCNTFVYDASRVNDPHALRKPINYYQKIEDAEGKMITIGPSGNKVGRPAKTQELRAKRPVGRPRKPQ